MDKSGDKSNQEQYRKKTDASLTIERDKTNKSIDETRRHVEHKTDQKVESARNLADSKTSADRSFADRSFADSKLQKNEAKEGAQLRAERTISDDKLERERSQADAAIEREREEVDKSTIELLKQERGRTDKNLQLERDETDSHSNSMQQSLSDEVAEHLKTKVSVTSRDELIAILSHDLRNPIGTISATAEMMALDTNETDKKQWIHIIKRNADRALSLIEDIFAMENIANGKFKLRLEKQNLQLLLEEVVEMLQLAAKEKSISLKLEPIDQLIEANFDYGRMLQVFSNVVGNAIKFTPAGGKVVVAIEHFDDKTRVSVRDTGPGIPEDMRDQIFNRFSQISAKNRTGLGLGLYISKVFVEAHKGKIWVESPPGGGSVFYISLNDDFGAK